MDFALSRGRAFLFVLIVWALIYLPGLGREGLKGEEGRRVLPAIEMLKTGDWIMPRIGGKDYYNKPPGINWLVAGAFAITGKQSELTARLPSIAFVLFFVTLLIWMPASPKMSSRGGPGPWMSIKARLISAIIFMTNIALIEKGRLIEIEAVYISLTGIALLLWLNLWSMNGPKWLLWLAPSVVLAFGMLVKGPFILIFFYSVVISVLCYSRKFKSVFSIWHILGVGIILFLCLGWLYLAFKETSATIMSFEMRSQLLIRIIAKFEFLYWAQNVVRALIVFLPWLLFVPMLWDKSLIAQIESPNLPLFRGCRLGMVIGFAAIILMPKMEARYTMPVIPITCILLGWLLSLRKELVPTDRLWKNILLVCLVVSCLTALGGLVFISKSPGVIVALILAVCAAFVVLRNRNEIGDTTGLTLVTALVFIIGMLQYTSYGLDIVTSQETRRPAAMAINNAVPEGQTIYIYKPISYLYPTVFSLRPPVDYILDDNDVNEQIHYLLIKKEDLKALKAEKKTGPDSGEVLYELPDRIEGQFRLVHLNQ
jgi:4-amino-4-deoxy-L-arabinose transferase-like glycosyltransferase